MYKTKWVIAVMVVIILYIIKRLYMIKRLININVCLSVYVIRKIFYFFLIPSSFGHPEERGRAQPNFWQKLKLVIFSKFS